MSESITVEEWLAEVERLESEARARGATGDDGFTADDLATAKSIHPATASHHIGKLIDAGKLIHAGWQWRTNRIGGRKRVPVYRPTTDSH